MTTISISPANPEKGETTYRAIAGNFQSSGKTPGEALDALTAQLDPNDTAALVLVQKFQPDKFFTAEQQNRLDELMNKWRSARDSGDEFLHAEKDELEALVQTELKAATKRAADMARRLAP